MEKSETLDLRRRLDDSESLLQRSLIEKGAMVLRRLEADAVRAIELTALAERDLATGLLRHGSFRVRLDFEVRRSQRTGEPLALLLADLDEFTHYNERFGYDAGEQALRAIGQSLGVLWMGLPARRPPVLAREAGDCFAVLLPGADAPDMEHRAESVRDLVQRLPLQRGKLTASIGAVSRTANRVDRAELLAAANATLERARKAGGNRCILDPAPRLSVSDGG